MCDNGAYSLSWIALITSSSRENRLVFKYPSDSMPDDYMIDMLCPKASLWDLPFDVVVDGVRYVSRPSHVPLDCEQTTVDDDLLPSWAVIKREPEKQASQIEGLSMFNVVLALHGDHDHGGFISMVRSRLLTLSLSLLVEEVRRRYVSVEAELLSNDPSLERSELVKQLKDVFTGLKQSIPSLSTFTEAWQGTTEEVKPYQTLLLLQPRHDIIASLPPDSATTIAKVVQNTSPTCSLHSIMTKEGLDQTHVASVAKHLQAWHLARPSGLLNAHSVLIWNGNDVNNAEFEARFPPLRYLLVAHWFSTPRYLSVHLQRAVEHGVTADLMLDAITWLLAREDVIELGEFFTFWSNTDDALLSLMNGQNCVEELAWSTNMAVEEVESVAEKLNAIICWRPK